MMEIWVNPACSKCRTAVSEAEAAGAEFTIRRYLDDPPTPAEIDAVLDRLGLQPWDIARAKEAKDAGITLPRTPENRDRWIEALAQHPRAIQRPIITASDGTTVIARDPDTLAKVLATEK